MSLSLCKSKHESRTTSPLTSLNMHRPKYGGRRNKITGTGGLVWSNLGIWPKTMSWAKICGWCLGIGTKNIFSFLAVVVASKLEWEFVGDWVKGFRNTVSILSDGFKTYTPESKTPYKVVDARKLAPLDVLIFCNLSSMVWKTSTPLKTNPLDEIRCF